VPRVALAFNQFRAQGVPFRIVAVSPRADNLSLFKNLAGRTRSRTPVQRTTAASAGPRAPREGTRPGC
jgi:hypothetical protein